MIHLFSHAGHIVSFFRNAFFPTYSFPYCTNDPICLVKFTLAFQNIFPHMISHHFDLQIDMND